MLGLQIGRLPSELADQMLAAEEAAYLALFRTEPWGEHRTEIMLAQIAQILWNQNAKKDHRRKLTDFLPFYRKRIDEPEADVESKVKGAFMSIINRSKEMAKPQARPFGD